MDAWERSDIDAIIAMLTEEAVLAMPSIPTCLAVTRALPQLRAGPLDGEARWRMTPTSANGDLAFSAAGLDAAAKAFIPDSLAILTLQGSSIEQICAFHDPAFGSAVKR